VVPGEIMDSLCEEIQYFREFEGRKGVSVSERIRDWVKQTPGNFSIKDINKELNLTNPSKKSICSRILRDLVREGGIATLEKLRIYLTMTPQKLTIIKGKNWASRTNPNGLSRDFRIINGTRFEFEDWVRN
jgi:hypothetical protein